MERIRGKTDSIADTFNLNFTDGLELCLFANELGISDSASKRYLKEILKTVTPTPPLGLSLDEILKSTLGSGMAKKFTKYMETLYLGQITSVSSAWLDQFAMPWNIHTAPAPKYRLSGKNSKQVKAYEAQLER